MATLKESTYLTELFKSFVPAFSSANTPYLERCIYDQVHKAGLECPNITYRSETISGRSYKWFIPVSLLPSSASSLPDPKSGVGVILFLHGGGYSFGSPNGHRHLTAHLASHCNMLALSVDYRMSPEHPYPAAVDDCLAAYEHLLAAGFPSPKIITAGDSCGGGLATIIPLAAIQKQLPVPAAAISISPWYDATLSGNSMTTNSERDVLNTTAFVNKLADRYTSGYQELRIQPLISPLFAPAAQLRRLPPHWISCGGDDMLLDDGTRFAEVLKREGVEVRLEIHQGQQHVMEFMAGRAPEANRSLQDIGEWAKKIIANEGSPQ